MSLQGSLDTFALPDVLVLLSGTAKTGALQVTGSRSTDAEERTTQVWFDEGRLAGHDDPGSPEITGAVVSLLRMERGSFTFTPGPVPLVSETHDVDRVLAAARSELAEWADIESILPSPTAWLQLADHAPREQVTVTATQWRLLVAIGAGRSVHDAIADLAIGELSGFRAVKEMVTDGLLTVDAGAAATREDGGPPADAVPEPSPERLAWATPVSSWGERALSTASPEDWKAPPAEKRYGALRIVPSWGPEVADGHDLDVLVAPPPPAPPFSAPGVGDEPPTDDGATASPVPCEDEDVADQGDESLNRGLLLKFLSSVRN